MYTIDKNEYEYLSTNEKIFALSREIEKLKEVHLQEVIDENKKNELSDSFWRHNYSFWSKFFMLKDLGFMNKIKAKTSNEYKKDLYAETILGACQMLHENWVAGNVELSDETVKYLSKVIDDANTLDEIANSFIKFDEYDMFDVTLSEFYDKVIKGKADEIDARNKKAKDYGEAWSDSVNKQDFYQSKVYQNWSEKIEDYEKRLKEIKENENTCD